MVGQVVSIPTVMGHFGQTIRALREEAHLSQEDLAGRVGLKRNAISRAEQSESPQMHPRNYRALAEAFGLEPGQLDQMWRTDRFAAQARLEAVQSLDVPAPEWAKAYFGVDDPDAYLAGISMDWRSRGLIVGDRVLVSPNAPMDRSGLMGLVKLESFGGGLYRYIGECYQEEWGITVRLDAGLRFEVYQVQIVAVERVIGSLSMRRFPDPLEHKPLSIVMPDRSAKRRRKQPKKET